MNFKILLSAGIIAGGLAIAAPSAQAADDCCWDWSPTEAGVDDQNNIEPKDDPGSPWAQCTNTPSGGGGPGNPCFSRDGRQMIWFNWTCLPGSAAPPPGGVQSNPNSGFLCESKSAPDIFPQPKFPDPTPGQPGPIVIEGPAPPPIPTVSEWGMIVLGMLVLTGGTIAIRRARSASLVAA